MSGKVVSSNSQAGSRKKRKNKRQASSPLNDNNGSLNTDLPIFKSVSVSEQRTGQSKVCKQDGAAANTQTVSSFISDTNYNFQNMAFQTQPQSAPFNMTQTPFMQSPPPNQFNNSNFGFQPSTPPWASKLLEDVEQIKQKMQSIDKIEKTVNFISSKVSDLENKMRSLDTRVSENEKSCQFISNVNETNKTDLKKAKDDLSKLQKSCQGLEQDAKYLKDKNEVFGSKLTDLESRSMRDNLLFYGIQEGGNAENCDELVKGFCADILKIQTANEMKFDRAHRLGQKSGSKIRPIVVKFHNYAEREEVRKTSFNFAEQLKALNMGVGAQLPKEIRDARKPLYSVMKKAKDEGKNVKFVGKKLFINGNEYSDQPGEQRSMEH